MKTYENLWKSMKIYGNLWTQWKLIKIMRIHWKSMEINFRALSLRSTGILLVFCWYPFGRNQKFYSQPTRQPANPPTRQPASQPASQPTTWGLCSLQGKPTFFIDLVSNPGVTFQNGPFRTSCFATSIMKYCFFCRGRRVAALALNGFGPPPELL